MGLRPISQFSLSGFLKYIDALCEEGNTSIFKRPHYPNLRPAASHTKMTVSSGKWPDWTVSSLRAAAIRDASQAGSRVPWASAPTTAIAGTAFGRDIRIFQLLAVFRIHRFGSAEN